MNNALADFTLHADAIARLHFDMHFDAQDLDKLQQKAKERCRIQHRRSGLRVDENFEIIMNDLWEESMRHLFGPF